MRLLRKRKSCNSTAGIYIASPCDGEVLPLQESKDPMFRDAVLGQGCFVYPKDDCIYAPVNGVVEAVFPTRHAIGIRSQSGLQLLLHFGINTVQLNGLYMKTHVRKGDVITEGKLLAEMNIAGVIKVGYDPDVYVIILESEHKKVTVFEREVYHGETLMEVRDTTERMQIE